MERGKLQRQARDLGLDNVQFTGALPPEEVPAYYRCADLLVFPTLHDVWGLVVSEALWSGLPVLASKHADCASELLPAEQVFDPLEPEDFVAKLRRALDVGLPPVDTTPLMPVQEVADAIADSIEQVVSDRIGRD
jgi:glycosyltransferase involved in cell wall biosynthesis